MENPLLSPERLHRAELALAQQELCEILALLADAGSEGLPAGIIANELDLLPSALTSLLSELLSIGLIECAIRVDRVRYRADLRRLYQIAPELMASDRPCARGYSSTLLGQSA